MLFTNYYYRCCIHLIEYHSIKLKEALVVDSFYGNIIALNWSCITNVERSFMMVGDIY